MSSEGNTICKVSVSVLDLELGGESLMNPCGRVFRYVTEMSSDNFGTPCFEVDFGDDLGVQSVPQRDCKPWTATPAFELHKWGLQGLLRKAQGVPCGTEDVLAQSSRPISPSQVIVAGSGQSRAPRGQQGAGAGGADSDPDWNPEGLPVEMDGVGGAGGGPDWRSQGGFSSGDSGGDSDEGLERPSAGLGEYRHGPLTEEEQSFEARYAEAKRHAKTWQLEPRQ